MQHKGAFVPGETLRVGRRLGLRVGEGELSPELDREAEDDVFVDRLERLDGVDAPSAEPVAYSLHELFGRRRSRGDSDRLDPLQPLLVDVGLVVDEVGRHTSGASDLYESVRVRGVA